MSQAEIQHPASRFVHPDKLHSQWCPGCGIGIILNTFIRALEKKKFQPENAHLFFSGLGCFGSAGDHLKIATSYQSPENILQEAAQIKKDSPETLVSVFLSDSDLLATGFDPLFQLREIKQDLCLIYFNSFIFHLLLLDKDVRPILVKKNGRDLKELSPFNLPLSMDLLGVDYIARWTPLHSRRLSRSIADAIEKKGKSFIEIISPCLMVLASQGLSGQKVDRMGPFIKDFDISHGLKTISCDTRSKTKIKIGKFIDR